MKTLNKVLAVCVLGLTMLAPAFAADDKGSSEQAVAMVKKAIAYIKEVGKEKAFAEFANPANTQFHDRDLYLFVYDLNGNTLAHGNNPKMVGKSLIDLKDGDGKPIIREMIALVNTKGKGWADYKWPNPVTKALEAKSSYVEKVDNYFVGCGIYK